MLILGIEMELLTMISIVMMAFTIVLWLLREWSWYSYQYKMHANIIALQETNDDLFLRLQMEEAAQPQCLMNSTEDITFSNITTSFTSSPLGTAATTTGTGGGLNNLIYPAPVFFDLSGLAQLCIFCSIILIEYYYLHLPHLSLAGDNPTEQSIKREVQEFLLKKHPVTNILVFSVIAFLSLLAWWNLLPRTTFLDICFKVLLALVVSSPLAFVTHNLLRIQQYFPRDREAWDKAIWDGSWWLWLLSRLVGTYDIKSATKTAIWLFCVGWYVWPVRYFFYYRFISCGHSDSPSQDTCGDGDGGLWGLNTTCNASVDRFYATNNIFYINMLGQGALLMLCCNIAYVLTMLKAVNITANSNNSDSAEDKNMKHKKNTTYSTGMGIDSSQYGIIGAILRNIDNANAVSVMSLLSLLNSIVAVLRVLWFAVFSSCSWYAVMIACMFVHMHVGVTIYALPSINALMQKYSTISAYKSSFIEQFQKHQRDLNNANKNTTSASTTTAESEEDEEQGYLAQEIFNKVLTDAVLYYLFLTNMKSEHREPGNEETSSDSKLSVIFQAFLQTAFYSYQPPEEDGEHGDEQGQGSDCSEKHDEEHYYQQQQPAQSEDQSRRPAATPSRVTGDNRNSSKVIEEEEELD